MEEVSGRELEQQQTRRQLLIPCPLQTKEELLGSQMKGRTDELVEKRCLSRHPKTLHEIGRQSKKWMQNTSGHTSACDGGVADARAVVVQLVRNPYVAIFGVHLSCLQ